MLVRTLERAFFILNILIEEKKPLGITELSRYSGFSKPTVFRIVQTLESFGFLIRQGSNKYWLGTKILEWSNVISERFDICAVALPIMQKLRDESKETTQLNIRENFERVCIYCLYGTEEVRLMTGVGQRSPLHLGASAKVLLAFSDDRFIEQYINHYQQGNDQYGPLNAEDVWKEVQKIRQLGYGYSIRERTKDGVGISAPVLDGSGRIIAAIAITAPAMRSDVEVKRYTELVIQAGKDLSHLLGYRF